MIGNLSTKHKAWNLLIAAVLLLPSAWYLTQFSDLPSFGRLHDDSLYFVGAKSLAEGHGYRIESLPGAPAQTKYPPLYPLLLSIAWKVNPAFPQNLIVAGWLSWLALPALVAQLWWLFSGFGFDRKRTWGLLALFSLNPYVILFSSQFLFSELWFLALSVAAMLAIEHALRSKSARWAIAAGGIAGLAYLTRSAGLALFTAGAIYLWIAKERRLAGLFAAAAAPFALGWMLWARLHQAPTNDPELIYYLDYFRYQAYAISWSDLPIVLWKNVDGLLVGFGTLIIPKITGSLFEKILSQVIAVAMISGVVRMVRRGKALLFALFAAFSCVLLVIWHFPPTERLVMPLFPLALAGLLVEGEHFVSLLRASRNHKDRSQRVAAMGMIGVAGVFALVLLGVQGYVSAAFLAEDARLHQATNADRNVFYRWVSENTPPEATILSSDDVLLYLHTGRRAMRRPLPPFLWYREDHPGTIAWLGEPTDYAREHGLTYFDFAGVDASLGVEGKDVTAIEQKLASDPALQPLMQSGKTMVYAVRPRTSAELHTAPPPPAQ